MIFCLPGASLFHSVRDMGLSVPFCLTKGPLNAFLCNLLMFFFVPRGPSIAFLCAPEASECLLVEPKESLDAFLFSQHASVCLSVLPRGLQVLFCTDPWL